MPANGNGDWFQNAFEKFPEKLCGGEGITLLGLLYGDWERHRLLTHAHQMLVLS
jgi:hypothetical protein